MADQPPPYPGGNEKAYPPQPQTYQPPPPVAGYPQPGALPLAQPNQSTTVVITQPATDCPLVVDFGGIPVRTLCPHCRGEVDTELSLINGSMSWFMCVILCVIGCNLGCCLIPLCMESCQDVVHTCPNCKQEIGRWARM